MYLILMRHGEAVPQTEDVPNRERRLTKEGKKQVRTTSRMLARFLKDRPLRIFASPAYPPDGEDLVGRMFCRRAPPDGRTFTGGFQAD